MKKNIILAIIVLIVALSGASYFFLNQTNPSTNSSQLSPTPLQDNAIASSFNPPKDCKQPTPIQTEGPYYKTGSPERSDLTEPGITGEVITVTGYVMDANCQRLTNAWLDFWQADGEGVYDNSTYKLRGHQFTDEEGKYILKTVIPGEYPGRTPHIHVKVGRSEAEHITTQLYFPSASQNESDSIFTPATLLEIRENGEKVGYYNFYLTQ